jgi:P-type Cu+ transporter
VSIPGPQDVAVLVALALVAFLAWFFLGPRRARAAEIVGDAREARVTVRPSSRPTSPSSRAR